MLWLLSCLVLSCWINSTQLKPNQIRSTIKFRWKPCFLAVLVCAPFPDPRGSLARLDAGCSECRMDWSWLDSMPARCWLSVWEWLTFNQGAVHVTFKTGAGTCFVVPQAWWDDSSKKVCGGVIHSIGSLLISKTTNYLTWSEANTWYYIYFLLLQKGKG